MTKARTKVGAADIIVCITAFLLAAIIFFSQRIYGADSAQTVLLKTDTDETVYKLSEDRTVDIVSCGHTLKIEIRDGAVCVSESDCPDKVCVSSGWTSDPSRPIVCAPAKVLVRIQSDGGEDDADFIAGR